MLRNHFGWARRLSGAALLLVPVLCTTVRGGPIIDGSTLVPVALTPSTSPPFTPPTTYSLSGFVYVDAAEDGVKLPGEWGLQNVTLTLNEYSSGGAMVLTSTAATNGAGYYLFPGLQPGDTCTVTETQPGNYSLTTSTIGSFLSATGGNLGGAVNGAPAGDPNELSVVLPSPTGAFAPDGSSVYSAVNFNFGELPLSPIGTSGIRLPLTPGVPASSAATAPNGSLSAALALTGTNDRFLAGPGGGVLSLTATVANPSAAGYSAVNWQVSSLSSGLSVSSTGGSGLAAQSATTFTAIIDGANLSAGAQNAVFTISGQATTSGALLPGSTASALVDPVYSRGIDSVSTANFGRIMQGGAAGSSFTVSSTGAYLQYSNLTMNPASLAAADSAGNYIVANTGPVLFNGSTTTSPALAVSATFSSAVSGPLSGSVTLPGNSGLFTGETLAAGTPVLPSLVVPYTATVLAPRSLQAVTGGAAQSAIAVPVSGGGLLSGTVVSLPDAYLVTSTNANPDSDHTSMVNVSGQTAAAVSTADGVTQVGTVTAGQTLFNSGGTQAVNINIAINSFGPTSGSAGLSVATAEAASVQDNTAYPSLPVYFKIPNVGYAAVGGADPSNANNQLLGAALSGTFVAGSRLSSRVAATGSQGQNSVTTGYDGSTLSQQSTVTSSNVTGTVGSECDIFADPTMSGSYSVTMAWRARNADENGSAFINGNPTSTNWSTVLPAGVPALTSDVVELGGLPSGLAYAMQISYDDRINTFLNGSTGSATVQDAYVVKQVGPSGNTVWENAVLSDTTTGSLAQTAVNMPLENVYDSSGNLVTEGFLNMEFAQGYTLSQLVGSYGVDLANGEAWAIVDSGSGDFAVVPEPSTLALLGTAAAGLLAYRLRRKR